VLFSGFASHGKPVEPIEAIDALHVVLQLRVSVHRERPDRRIVNTEIGPW
jgi:hypothetical protein